MYTLILADHDGHTLSPTTAALVTAGKEIGHPVTILVAGEKADALAQAAAALDGVKSVLLAESSAYGSSLAEPLAALLAHLSPGYAIVLASGGSLGKDVLPRAAALSNAPQISDVVKIVSSDTFQRSAYAGNALETIRTLSAQTFMTVRASSFAAAMNTGNAEISAVDFQPPEPRAHFKELTQSKSKRPDISSARIVVSGGRAFGSKERFEEFLAPLADKLNAAIGASRAAVDAGYVANDLQIGQTGRVVAPDLYIACGISGAIQHIAGMKGSKIIVAINSDRDASIFEYADYGLVADIFTAIPELTAKV